MGVANADINPIVLGMEDPADVPHCWEQGPLDVRRLPKRRYAVRRTPEGHKIRRGLDWEFLWYLNDVRGTTRAKAKKAIRTVLYHRNSWERTGVRWREVYSAEAADILVNVIPRDDTVCGPGSGGCYSWGYKGPKPLAEMGVEYIDNPEQFAELVNMELCGHGTFRMHDMYLPGAGHDVNNYNGVMGTWAAAASTGYYPSDTEIEEARLWLLGRARFVHEHNGGGQTAHDHSGHSH